MPTCQSPVPADAIISRPSTPLRCARVRNTTSAVGERQILPVHTNSTRCSVSWPAPPSPASVTRCPWPSGSLHVPAVADDQRLARERIGGESREEQGDLGNVVEGSELAVDRLLEHEVLDDFLFGDAQRAGLLGNLLFDQRRAHE